MGFITSLWTDTFLASAIKIYTLNCVQCTQSHQLIFAFSPCHLLEMKSQGANSEMIPGQQLHKSFHLQLTQSTEFGICQGQVGLIMIHINDTFLNWNQIYFKNSKFSAGKQFGDQSLTSALMFPGQQLLTAWRPHPIDSVFLGRDIPR